jgi:hypothetical protein
MEKQLKKFLDFNGKTIYFLSVDGTYWVAIKPICEAIGVDYEGQRKNLKKDKFWDQLPSIQTVVAADKRSREMLCLPEQFIYGWICSIQSSNPELIAYKKKCYQLLYDYFHGTITNRKELITEKAKRMAEMETLEAKLRVDPDYAQLVQLEGRIKTLNQELAKQDKLMMSEQLGLFQ